MKNFDEIEEQIRFSIKKIETYYRGINEDNIESPKNMKSVDAICWRITEISRLLSRINGEYISKRCEGLSIDAFSISILKIFTSVHVQVDVEEIPKIISENLQELKKMVNHKDKSLNLWEGEEIHQTTFKKSIRTVKK